MVVLPFVERAEPTTARVLCVLMTRADYSGASMARPAPPTVSVDVS